MDLIKLGQRLLNFYGFITKQNWEGGISFYEKEFHVSITCNGNIYSYGQADRLSVALDECLSGLQKVGI